MKKLLLIFALVGVASLQAQPKVLITAKDNSDNETGFRVQRSALSATAGFIDVKTLPSNVGGGNVSWTDTLVAAGTQYWYRVLAFNSGGDSGFSNVVAVTTSTTITIPATPSAAAATTPAVEGGLINVSARSLVTTDDATTIPGFTISGTEVKKILVRVVGPGLSSFGVPNVLADPRLELKNQAGVTVIANDNWEEGTQAANLVIAAATVNAFPLKAGSKDAAVMVSLQPGQYTIVCRGVGNTNGTVLAEVYLLPN